MKANKLGTYKGEAVYLTGDGLAIEKDYQHLIEVRSPWGIAEIVHSILGEKELHGLKGLKHLSMRVKVASTKCRDCGEYGAWQHDLREYDPDFETGIYGGHNGEFIVYLCDECDQERRKEVSK